MASPMSGGLTFDTEKIQKPGEFKTPPCPTGKGSNKSKTSIAERINRHAVREIGNSDKIFEKSFKNRTEQQKSV